MTHMFVPQDVVDSQLAGCTDGETGDFTIRGATFTTVPGGALVTGETVTKSGYKEPAAVVPKPMMEPGMSAEAGAVVGRKPRY